MKQLYMFVFLIVLSIGLQSSKVNIDGSRIVATVNQIDDCICVKDRTYTVDCKCEPSGTIVKATCTKYVCSTGNGVCSDGCESCYSACERAGILGGARPPVWSPVTNIRIDIYNRRTKNGSNYMEFGAPLSPANADVQFHGFKLELYQKMAEWESYISAKAAPSQCRVFFRFYDATDQLINKFPIAPNQFIEIDVDQVGNQQKFSAIVGGDLGNRWQDVSYGFLYIQSRKK
ncbi:hypothetical protein [Dyadobacter sp. NIV53]|uniref:hypothetical protein n=1 Tax=Dyadobacter sp. NIV53 TaxID=2861765 RepID=UPI001C88C4CA|nr:hypothetical protein [Dyadobacter sp. NIV53]